jgi:hypothetical protein
MQIPLGSNKVALPSRAGISFRKEMKSTEAMHELVSEEPSAVPPPATSIGKKSTTQSVLCMANKLRNNSFRIRLRFAKRAFRFAENAFPSPWVPVPLEKRAVGRKRIVLSKSTSRLVSDGDARRTPNHCLGLFLGPEAKPSQLIGHQ